MKWILVFLAIVIVAVALFRVWLARVRRISEETGVYPAGRDELHVVIGPRRYWIGSEICVGGQVERQVYTTSVRDITESGSFKGGVEVNPQVAEDVLRRVRDYYQRRGTRVEYVSK